MARIEVKTDLDENINKLSALLNQLNEAEEKAVKLQFLTIKDMIKITGWSAMTVQELFRRADFPSCDFGKEKIAEIHAVISYFSVPRRK